MGAESSKNNQKNTVNSIKNININKSPFFQSQSKEITEKDNSLSNSQIKVDLIEKNGSLKDPKRIEEEEDVPKNDPASIDMFDLPLISIDDYDKVEEKIEELTGFRPYYPIKIEFNETKQEIKGTYFQYNKGCVLYSFLNCGWIDERFVPDSMKYYNNHTHKEDQKNNRDLLRKIMSLLDLSQLWINLGGKCPYTELSLKEIKKKIFLILKKFFDSHNEKEKNELMDKANLMTWQNKDYYELIHNIKVEFTPLKDLLNENPCIKNGIDTGVIKKRDIVKFGRHCFIYDETFEENSQKIYSFQDSLAYFFSAKMTNYNNCECNKKKGFIFAREDTKFINIVNDDDMEIGILNVFH